jgi:hypothetical protein
MRRVRAVPLVLLLAMSWIVAACVSAPPVSATKPVPDTGSGTATDPPTPVSSICPGSAGWTFFSAIRVEVGIGSRTATTMTISWDSGKHALSATVQDAGKAPVTASSDKPLPQGITPIDLPVDYTLVDESGHQTPTTFHSLFSVCRDGKNIFIDPNSIQIKLTLGQPTKPSQSG